MRKIVGLTELTAGQWAGHVVAVCDDGAAFVGNLALLFATGASGNWVRVPDVPQVPTRSIESAPTASGVAEELKRNNRPARSP